MRYERGLALVPGLTLDVEEYCAPQPIDDERFRRLFVGVWAALPEADRKVLSSFLQGGTVKITDNDYDSDLWGRKAEGSGALANFHLRSESGSRMLCFWSRALDLMPDEVAEVVFAHELGHAYCLAICLAFGADEYPAHGELPTRGESEEAKLWRAMSAEEEVAEVLGQMWDFSQEALNTWIDGHQAELKAMRELDNVEAVVA